MELEESGSLTSDYTQKQTYSLMEQNRKPRNKPIHLWSIYNKGGKTIQWRKDKSLQYTVLGKLDSYM